VRRRQSAGRSSDRKFRQERRKAIREIWRDFVLLVATIVGLAVWLALDDDGTRRVIAAFTLGVATTVLVVGWMLGFDARLLRWRWGAAGEQWTAEELAQLGSEWHVVHDVPDGQRNWDHIAVGPSGVFAIDSKNLSGRATVDERGLRAGRLRMDAVAARGSALRLRDAIERASGRRVWVQGVVVVWGELKGGVVERDRVLYAPGPEVTTALLSRPRRLAKAEIDVIAGAVRGLSGA
jgi:hypothetical protein